MNYQKIYNQLVERALTREKPDCYTEKHHIIPKCMGGSDSEENLVVLTAREHFLCHWLLARIYPENTKLGYAFWAMCLQKGTGNKQNRYKPSSRIYEEAKKLGIILIKQVNRGRIISEEHREKVRESRLGRRDSEETRKKKSEVNMGKKRSPVSLEVKLKISNSTKGKVVSDETKELIRQARLGVPRTEETKQKLHLAHKGIKKSKEHTELVRSKNLGKKRTQEQRIEMSKRASGIKKSPEHSKNISEALKLYYKRKNAILS